MVGLRAATSTGGMTVDFHPFEMDFIRQVGTRIINEVKGVNGGYDATSKPPGNDRVGVEGGVRTDTEGQSSVQSATETYR